MSQPITRDDLFRIMESYEARIARLEKNLNSADYWTEQTAAPVTAAVNAGITTHEADTTAVHGIADTSTLIATSTVHPAAKVTKSSAQSPTNTTLTLVTLDAATYDRSHGGTAHFVNASDSLVCRVNGHYEVKGQIDWAVNGTGGRALYLRLNGNNLAFDFKQAVAATAGTVCNASVDVDLVAGDVITMHAQQWSGAAVALSTTGTTWLSFKRLGASS